MSCSAQSRPRIKSRSLTSQEALGPLGQPSCTPQALAAAPHPLQQGFPRHLGSQLGMAHLKAKMLVSREASWAEHPGYSVEVRTPATDLPPAQRRMAFWLPTLSLLTSHNDGSACDPVALGTLQDPVTPRRRQY